MALATTSQLPVGSARYASCTDRGNPLRRPVVVSTSIGRVGTPVIATRPPDHRNSEGSTFAATWATSHDPGRVAENAFTAREYTPYPYHAADPAADQ